MSRTLVNCVGVLAIGAAVLGSAPVAAQDKDAVKVPDGLGFADFRGYEGWQTIAVSQAADVIAVIVGNPVVIKAYADGFPGNGKPFPDGAKLAKIHWKAVKSTDAPRPTTVPGALADVGFMVKDSAKYADNAGWGFAHFNYDVASETFKPLGTGYKCGTACHTIAKAKDYVFTGYAKR